MAYYIPFEIQAEIIKRLPVKSLIRFKSVSKPWNSLIHSSQFIVDYHVIHLTQPQHRLLLRFDDPEEDSKQNFVSIVDDDDTFPKQKLSLTVPMSLNKQCIIGSSHGLLCFKYINYDDKDSDNYRTMMVVLWNPTIRKSVSIDVPNVLESPYKTIFGFGICPDIYDPKLVKIILDRNLGEIYTVEVLTLSSGVWRSPHSNLPRKQIGFTQCGVDIDGFIYWCAFDYIRLPALSHNSNMIMSFSMKSEEFTEIRLPDCLVHNFGIDLSISKLRRSLVVLEFSINPKDQVYHVWIMSHGDPKSFTYLFNINLPDVSIRRVHGFRTSGEAIVKVTKDEHDAVSVYEPNSKSISCIGISGKSHSYFLGSYMETLLLLDH